MKKLVEFRQSEEKPIQHLRMGGQEAHKSHQLLSKAFQRAGVELAKPQPKTDADGTLRIDFLTAHDNMPSEAISSLQGSPHQQAFEQAFQKVNKEAKSMGIDSAWIEDIRNNCLVFCNGTSFSLAWGMTFYPPTKVPPPPPPILGCTDPRASNYNPEATIDNGSCKYSHIPGCTDPGASNYNPQATIDDGSCITPPPIYGCTNPEASNYNPKATIDDGTCEFPVWGCTDPNALNYNPNATRDDGSCLYERRRFVGWGFSWWPWVLFALLLLLLALLLLFADGCNGAYANHYSPVTGRFDPNPLPGFTPDVPNNMVPITDEQLVVDPITGALLAEGRMNVYPKNQSVTFTGYLEALQEAVGAQSVTVADYCHETRRVQLDIGELDFDAFKEELKGELAAFDLLIWPERIYSTNAATATAVNTPQALGSWHLDAVKAREVLARGQGSQAITIAVIDSGFDTDHPGLNQDTTSIYHVVRRDHEVYASPNITHGTHVAGLAISESLGSDKLQGIGFGCQWMPIQLTDVDEARGFSQTQIIDGILYALNHGADVVNLSLGLLNPEFVLSVFTERGHQGIQELIEATQDDASLWDEIFQMGEDNNCLFVIAAGNESCPMELDPMQRSSYPVYVAATNNEDKLAEFSNFPTRNLLTSAQTTCVAAPGDSLLSCSVTGDVMYMKGTSMAAPVVAGALGFVRSEAPQLSNLELRGLLQAMPEQVNTSSALGWVLSPTPALRLTSSTWTFYIDHDIQENVTLQFSSDGTFSCTNCTDNYQRGTWELFGAMLKLRFESTSGSMTANAEGFWDGQAFGGTGARGEVPATFTLTPQSLTNLTHRAAFVPFLDVEYLIDNATTTEL
jgi:subtilisin family serine protease